MSRRTKGVQYMTTRKIYNDVKKYDRQQFDMFCTGIYKEGFRDGKEATPGITMDQVREAVLSVKGIGEARMQKIIEALEKKAGGGTRE